MQRREFLKTSSLTGAAALTGLAGGTVRAAEGPREFYELESGIPLSQSGSTNLIKVTHVPD